MFRISLVQLVYIFYEHILFCPRTKPFPFRSFQIPPQASLTRRLVFTNYNAQNQLITVYNLVTITRLNNLITTALLEIIDLILNRTE